MHYKYVLGLWMFTISTSCSHIKFESSTNRTLSPFANGIQIKDTLVIKLSFQLLTKKRLKLYKSNYILYIYSEGSSTMYNKLRARWNMIHQSTLVIMIIDHPKTKACNPYSTTCLYWDTHIWVCGSVWLQERHQKNMCLEEIRLRQLF